MGLDFFSLGALESTAGEERILVDYHEFLTQPAFQTQRIATAFRLEIQEDLLKEYSTDFIDPSLSHFREAQFPRNGLTCNQELALAIYERLLLLARDQMTFDQLSSFLEQWKTSFATVKPLLMMAEKNEQTLLLYQAAVLVYREKMDKIRH